MRTSRLRLVLLFLWILPTVVGAQRRDADPVTLAKQGAAAMAEKRYGDALDAFAAAARLAPKDPSLCVASGIAAMMLGRNDDAEEWFSRALKLDAQFQPASLWLGELEYREGRVDDAIETYETALKRSPGDAALEQRLQAWRKEADLQDRFYQSHGAHFDVLFEGPTDDALGQRVVQTLEAERLRIGAALGAYPSSRIMVVLYTTEQFRDVTRVPNWTAGAYDGRIRVPVRGAAAQSQDLDRVLSHEYVHAVVASLAGPNVPMWLNEGLATWFEPGGPAWCERVLARTRGRPRLAQLERGFDGLTDLQATVAYAFSEYAVSRMFQQRGSSSVVLLLQDLGQGVPFEEAFHQRIGVRFDEFEAALARE